MKLTPLRNLNLALLLGAATVVGTTSWAANIIKADNADNLNLGSSWVLGTPPTSLDIGVWNFTVTTPNSTVLGANTNWAGIKILDPNGLVTISAGNTLTLCASGIDL